jgi:predicted small lipoprotein YifL
MIRIAIPLACLLLAACGQRGGLYMPDDARPTVVPVTPATAQPAAPAAEDATTTDEQRRRQQQAAPANNAPGN